MYQRNIEKKHQKSITFKKIYLVSIERVFVHRVTCYTQLVLVFGVTERGDVEFGLKT